MLRSISTKLFPRHISGTVAPRTSAAAFHSNAALKDQMSRAEVSGKRFWKTAGVKDMGGTARYPINLNHVAVTLDGRVLKTPGSNKLTLPKEQKYLAMLIAGEWQGQKELLKPHTLPMTSLVARAIDGFIGNEQHRTETLNRLVKYLDTDSICYQQSFPDSIVKAQEEHWNPILEWVKNEYGLDIKVSQGITYVQQDEPTKQKLRDIVNSMTDIELAAFERATMTAKSFLIGLAVVKRRLSVEEGWKASSLEVLDQIDRWGEVEDSHDVDREFIKSQLASARLVNVGTD
ncbi:ATP synthase complex assembly protein atp12 [Lunasporangiospora selenospora]|uniref:ATP synthase complex assembly protein atp12 n=1 Tax=Lunasporangiospora selenospora TaxID=979761 RepID=A0A9P6FVB9_9FUNG|nr:ATP synthase complex assembly protein atp12 [Lunasporangiospora selenospora]